MNENNKKKKVHTIPIGDNLLTSREFQVFLILLTFERMKKSLFDIKNYIDEQFEHNSRTKSYDYINSLCEKGMCEKKKISENGKRYVTVLVNKKVRSEYEKFIAPTVDNFNAVVKELIQDNRTIIRDVEKNREKFRNYTDTIIDAVKELISKTPVNVIKNKRFNKKLEELIWTEYRVEMFKSQMFST